MPRHAKNKHPNPYLVGKRRLMPHQRRALHFLRQRHGCAGLFMAPGTGKTLTAIRYANNPTPPKDHTARRFGCVLVLCRRDDYLTWEDELGQEGIRAKSIHAVENGDDPIPLRPWILCTYDLLRNDHVLERLERLPFRLAIADESHKIKGWTSKRTRNALRLVQDIPQRIAMSGTPLTNDSAADIFPQAMFIDGGRAFGTNFWAHRERYYIKVGPGWVPKRDARERMQRRLEDIAIHFHEDDVLNLPPVRRVKIGVPMSGVQRRRFERIVDLWEYELNDGREVEFDHVIVQVQKLNQVASGFVYDEDGVPHWMRNHKIKRLRELMTDDFADREKVVIWCAHTAAIDRIAEEFARAGLNGIVTFGGSESKDRKSKRAARLAFRDDPGIRFFIGQVESGVGMNELKCANLAVYFSNSDKVEAREQSERRTRRKGSERHDHITYVDMVTERSLENARLRSLMAKRDFGQSVLDALKHSPAALRRLASA